MNFRRWFTVLSVLVLFVGLASAQSANSLTCSANTTGTPTIRGEGYTELIGDIVLTCTGGSISAGNPIPQVNITVAMNQPVTSRLLTTGTGIQPAVGTLSDAVLFVDDPGAMNGPLANYGPNAPQIVCTDPVHGCGGFAAKDASGVYNVPVLTAGTVPSTQDFPNIYQGIVNGNQVTFNGVPVLPPGTSANRTFRITNVRINATSLYQPSANLIAVTASISTNPSMYLPLQVSQPVVAYVTRGLNGSSKTTGTLNQCTSPSAKAPAQTATITFQEQFQTAFKTRILPVTGKLSTDTTTGQTMPGAVYNTESGLTIFGLKGAGTLTPGMANYPTRLKATFYNIPVGISGLYVDVTPSNGTAPTTPGDATTGVWAKLLTSETADAGAYVTVASPAPVTISSNQTATAVWEITNANANAFDTLEFRVYVAYTPNSAANQPSGTGQVVLSYAPTYDPSVTPAAQYASDTLPIPRFAPYGTSPANIMNIVPCQTVLLWPYVTTFTGFNTGIAISNTSKDPGKDVISGGAGSSTTPQGGTCGLYLYGTAEFGTAPTMPLTTPRIEAGTTYSADLASLLGSSYSVATGYLFAVCNFQYAHGYAAISDVHFDKFLSSYLALVVNSGDPNTTPTVRGMGAENFNQ